MESQRTVSSLRRELRSFADEHPQQSEFVREVESRLDEIVNDFAGETQTALLDVAWESFERHRETVRHIDGALERLNASVRRGINEIMWQAGYRRSDGHMN